MRQDGRNWDQLRKVKFTRRFTETAPGSVLIEAGKTMVLCTVSVDHKVPDFLAGKGVGWVTSEYAMLPAAGGQRKPRDRAGKVDGRSQEIQRLVGRSLRAVVDTELLGEVTLWVDCDVLQADGGTRCASITGAYVALVDAVRSIEAEGVKFAKSPIKDNVAAISVGIVRGEVCVDLNYREDSKADVDMNLIMTGHGQIVELQGTAEHKAFTREQLTQMLDAGQAACQELVGLQELALRQEPKSL